jgi:hypothetical protein
MAEFKNPSTVVEIVRDRAGMFRLAHPIIYYSSILDRDIIVPCPYETDFASIPKFLRDRICVNGLHREAAIVHDYLCTHGYLMGVTQKQADRVFHEAMAVLNVPTIERWVMDRGVVAYQRFKHWRKGVSYG